MLGDDVFRTIEHAGEGLYKEKGSKFIGYIYPVQNEEQIKAHISDLKKAHHSARHHCYAYRLGYELTNFKSNDDGEPSNTAGKPIYGQIQSNELTDVLIVVVRYFGGIKLGVGGLITAYRAAAADAIENAKIIEKLVLDTITIHFEYPLMNSVMRIIKDFDLAIIDQVFEMDCTIQFEVRKTLTPQVILKLDDIDGVRVES